MTGCPLMFIVPPMPSKFRVRVTVFWLKLAVIVSLLVTVRDVLVCAALGIELLVLVQPVKL